MPSHAAMEAAAARRVAVLEAIADSVRTRRYPPSVTELATRFDVSRRQIDLDLGQLVEAGVIERDPGVSRGIRLVTASSA